MAKTKLIRFPSHASRMREEGQTMAEYGVVLAVITIKIVTAFAAFSTRIEQSLLQVVQLVPK